jgi:hypothetical protein
VHAQRTTFETDDVVNKHVGDIFRSIVAPQRNTQYATPKMVVEADDLGVLIRRPPNVIDIKRNVTPWRGAVVRNVLRTRRMPRNLEATANATEPDVGSELIACLRPPIEALERWPNLGHTKVALPIVKSLKDVLPVGRRQKERTERSCGAPAYDSDIALGPLVLREVQELDLGAKGVKLCRIIVSWER